MSCLEGYNKDTFLNEVAGLSQTLMGKKMFTLRYDAAEHEKRYSWLLKQANMSNIDDFDFDDEGYVIMNVIMDEVIYERYMKEFEHDIYQEMKGDKKRKRLAPPPGWNA
jgi:hypothetical protein